MNRLPQPDFLARPPRPGVLAWAAACTGAVVLALSVWDALALQSQISDQRSRLALAEAKLQRVSEAQGRGSVVTSISTTATATNQREADFEARQLHRLNYPWPQLFMTLELATPSGVHWKSLDHAADRADLRLVGTAINADQAVDLVDTLAGWAGWSSVTLRNLVLNEAQGGVGLGVGVDTKDLVSKAAQFEVEAQFNAPGRPAGAPDLSGVVASPLAEPKAPSRRTP